MAKKKGWYSATRHCPPGHHWDGHKCVVTVSKTPAPAPGGTPTPAPTPDPGTTGGTSGGTSGGSSGGGTSTAEPFAGTITPAVADSGDSGVPEAAGGGDMTGTAQIMQEAAAVFGSGAGSTPQYHYDLTPQQAPTPAAMSEPQTGG